MPSRTAANRQRRRESAAVAADLSRRTEFTRAEVLALLRMHRWLANKRSHRLMDRQCFADFMDAYLGVKNADAVGEMHRLCCAANKNHMTGREFVCTLSLLLHGSLADAVKLSFDIYTEILRSSVHANARDGAAAAASGRTVTGRKERDSTKAGDLVGSGRTTDDSASLDSYRISVNGDVTWSKFLERILPTPDNIRLFMRTFTDRPYVDKTETFPFVRQRPEITAKTLLSVSRMIANNSEVLH